MAGSNRLMFYSFLLFLKISLGNLMADLLNSSSVDGMRKSSSCGRFRVNPVTAKDEVKPEDVLPNIGYSAVNAAYDANGDATGAENPLPLPILKHGHHKMAHGDRSTSFDTTNLSIIQQSSDSSAESDTESVLTCESNESVDTLDKPPNVDHYRNIMSLGGGIHARPTLAELQGRDAQILDVSNLKSKTKAELPAVELETLKPPNSGTATKFGWIAGVFMRCLLNILGVMLYLRLTWVTAQAGIGLASVIVLLATLVSVLTTLSMCAICTNGEVKGGGAYFMLSRSLDSEFGGSIGLIFAFANAVAMAMYVVGFAETVVDIMKSHGAIIVDNGSNDIRIIGLATALLLLGITFLGMSWESKTQVVLLIILVISIGDYIIGSFIPPNARQKALGIAGYSGKVFAENFVPDFRNGHDFFSVFAIFFPAATGILAGANISGDLTNPSSAIPKGTLLAVLVTSSIYMSFVWISGSSVVRDITADLPSVLSFGLPPCGKLGGTFNESANSSLFIVNNNATSCLYGLMNYYQIIEAQSIFGPLVTAGIFAATLSSALASLVSAPKIFQAVCKDKIFPYVTFFAQGSGASDEPRRAYALAFAVAVAMILIGNLDVIAPIISNFFLASYCLINYSCFDASLGGSPGFRPSFRYYNMWVSLFGALLCISVMFVISWWTALLTFAFVIGLYIYLRRRKPEVNWGSSSQAHSYKNALVSMIKLLRTEEHVKTYRPQILVLTGNPVARPSLVDFAWNISKGNSLMMCGHVIEYQKQERPHVSMKNLTRLSEEWLKRKRIKAFYSSVMAPTFSLGVDALMQISGMSKLRPNVLMMGFKNNWQKSTMAQISDYVTVLHNAFDLNLSVCIFRAQGGLDYTELLQEHKMADKDQFELPKKDRLPVRSGSFVDLEAHSDDEVSRKKSGTLTTAATFKEKYARRASLGIVLIKDKNTTDGNPPSNVSNANKSPIVTNPAAASVPPVFSNHMKGLRRLSRPQKNLIASINEFQRKIKKGVIDVYWFADAGGLTLLIPYLLTLHPSYIEGAKLRVFTIASSKGQLEQEQRSIATLLKKFRIDYSDVFVIPDITKKPEPSSINEFENLIADFRIKSELEQKYEPGYITDAEILAQKNKTNRQVRTREVLQQYSMSSSLIIMTLPVPRKGAVSSSLYMAWLDTLTKDLNPPVLLVRGNQTSVLTFYS